jgi:hypothetical protein
MAGYPLICIWFLDCDQSRLQTGFASGAAAPRLDPNPRIKANGATKSGLKIS